LVGTVAYIFISPQGGGVIQSVNNATLVAGKGIEGDRYYFGLGTFSDKLKNNPAAELTLIEKENIDKFNSDHGLQINCGDFRRNIVTAGVSLNDLVGRTFTIGKCKLKGVRLCEPCSHLATVLNPMVLPHLVGRGGLRAQILTSDVVNIGDKISD